jgi:hypothetical protein
LPSPEQGLRRGTDPVLEGRWVSGSAGYVLRIGLDLDVPSALFIRSERPLSNVPFLRRPQAVVEQALSTDLTAYVEWFLNTRQTVPQATRLAARRLVQCRLEPAPSGSN